MDNYILDQSKSLYVSDHPLAPYEYALAQARDFTIADLDASDEYADPATGQVRMRARVADGRSVRLAGMVAAVTKRVSKNGDALAIVRLEDMEGEVDVVVFPQLYKKCSSVLSGTVDAQTGEAIDDVFIRVRGDFERSDRGLQVKATEIEAMELIEKSNRPRVLKVELPSAKLSHDLVQVLKTTLSAHPGHDLVEIRVVSQSASAMRLELPMHVDARDVQLHFELNDLVGGDGRVAIA